MSEGASKVFWKSPLRHDTMASTIGDSFTEDGLPPSMLDLLESKLRGAGRKALLHRISVISRVSQGIDPHLIIEYYEKFFKSVTTTRMCEPVSGLLLIWPKFALHIIECSDDALHDFIKELTTEEGDKTVTRDSRVLNIAHDIQKRLYPQWLTKVLESENKININDEKPEITAVLIDVIQQLTKLGANISKQPNTKQNIKLLLDAFKERVGEFLPTENTIEHLLEDDSGIMFSPKELFENFERPPNVVLLSEITWPMQLRLFPYNN